MNDSILRGFLLLQPSSTPPYRGVDRQPFAPTLAAEELDPTVQPLTPEAPVWTFCRPGWRREAYRLYEENAVHGWGSLALIAEYQTAQRIEQLVEPHIGPHEIVICQVLELGVTPFREGPPEWNALGIDVAYPGGDFYSAMTRHSVTRIYRQTALEPALPSDTAGRLDSR